MSAPGPHRKMASGGTLQDMTSLHEGPERIPVVIAESYSEICTGIAGRMAEMIRSRPGTKKGAVFTPRSLNR